MGNNFGWGDEMDAPKYGVNAPNWYLEGQFNKERPPWKLAPLL